MEPTGGIIEDAPINFNKERTGPGFSLIRPGQSYQGMLVKMMPNPKAFLTEMLRKERAKGALETQQYINRVSQEIVDNRRRTNAEIRHENWLFLTGQEEYKNPFTGSLERGSSEYRYRWQNNQGEVLYCDENTFDPNRREEYNTKEWKRSEVGDRKK